MISEVEEGVTKLLLAIVDRCNTIPVRAMQTLPGMTPGEMREELEREFNQARDPIRNCEWIPAEIRESLGIKPVVPESGTSKPAKKKPRAKKTRARKRK